FGELDIGNGGTTGSIAGNIVDNASLIFLHSNAYTFGGQISGSGSVGQFVGLPAPGGVLTLSGHNTYSGGTYVAGGALIVTNNNSVGTGAVSLSNGTEL